MASKTDASVQLQLGMHGTPDNPRDRAIFSLTALASLATCMAGMIAAGEYDQADELLKPVERAMETVEDRLVEWGEARR